LSSNQNIKKHKLEIAPFTKRLALDSKDNSDGKLNHVGFGAMTLTFTPQAEKNKTAEIKAQKQTRRAKNKDRRSMKTVHSKFRKK